MKRFLVGAAVIVLALGAAAYFGSGKAQQPTVDPAMATCKDLLGEANSRVIALGAQNAKLSADLKATQDELAKLKEKP